MVRGRLHRALIVAAAAVTFAKPRPVLACSMCRCGDPTFNALGTDVYVAGRFRLALDWERFEKESAAEEEGGRDREVENRLTAMLAYSFGERVTLVARVPWSDRTLTTAFDDGSSRVAARALSDPEFLAFVRVFSSPFEAGVGTRSWLSLSAGVKTPWGENGSRAAGVRLDEHVQPGTGSTDLLAGSSFVHLLDRSSSILASLQARLPRENGHGYRYGDVFLASVAWERKLTAILDGVIELDYRHAARDRDSGAPVANTGGGILYVTPRAIVALGRDLAVRLGVQVPVASGLYGGQTERAVVNAGLTLFF